MKKILLLLVLCYSAAYPQANGSLDTLFGTNGKVFTDLPTSTIDFAYDGIQLGDGKILVGGYTNQSGQDNLLVKYLPDGQLDTTFGSNGIAVVDLGALSQTRKILLQPDGKIILGGRSGSSVAYSTVSRANADGTLDTAFGTNGFTRKVSGSESDVQAIMLLPDNKIIAVGYVLNNNADIQVMKLNADGSYDTTFGNNGIAVINFGSLSQRAFCGVMNGDKILIGGIVYNPNESSLLLQLNANGSIDTSFGMNGYTAVQFGDNPQNYYDRFMSLRIFENKIYAVGYREINPANYNINLAKFNIDGTPDTTFSDDGKLLIDTPSQRDFINDLRILQDGSILLAGVSAPTPSTNNFFMVRLNPDGTYKTDFGTNGIVTTTMGSNSTIQNVIVNEDNIVAVGDISSTNASVIALAKYNNFIPLGIEGPVKNKNFGVYPNPVTDKLNISTLSDRTVDAVEIIDASGKTVFKGENCGNALNLEYLSNGLYILKIRSGEKTEGFKFTKS